MWIRLHQLRTDQMSQFFWGIQTFPPNRNMKSLCQPFFSRFLFHNRINVLKTIRKIRTWYHLHHRTLTNWYQQIMGLAWKLYPLPQIPFLGIQSFYLKDVFYISCCCCFGWWPSISNSLNFHSNAKSPSLFGEASPRWESWWKKTPTQTTLRLHRMSWGVKTTCFKAPGVSLGGSGVSIGGVRSLRVLRHFFFRGNHPSNLPHWSLFPSSLIPLQMGAKKKNPCNRETLTMVINGILQLALEMIL